MTSLSMRENKITDLGVEAIANALQVPSQY